MERWLKILLGSVFGCLGTLVFFLIFERLSLYFKKRRQYEKDEAAIPAFTLRHVVGRKKRNSEELENLVYEEYDSQKHEVLAVCLENSDKAVGICLYLNDREIEYYEETFPDCCRNNTEGSDYVFRNVMAAVSFWATKWTYAEAVNLLCQSGDLVRRVSRGKTREWRAINQYENKNDFNMFIQWTDNYVCGEVANEDLWTETISLCRTLLKSNPNADLTEAWNDFPAGHWQKRRVKLKVENFHHVPHPGEVSADSESEDVGMDLAGREGSHFDVPVTDELVSFLR